MIPDGVSLLCDDGAHERCPGCECACHLYPSPAVRGAGEAQPPGAGDDAVPSGLPHVADVGSPPPHAHLDDL